MKVSSRSFLTLSLLAAAPALAGVSARTAEIFKRSNRELEPPSKDIQSTSEDSGTRYREGSRRLARKVARSDEDEDTAGASLYDQNYENPTRSDPDVSINPSARSRIRRDRGYKEFNGERTFGLGFMGAGAYGIFGAEIDFGLTDDWTAGLGIGTGMSYNTWAVHSRYFFQHARWSPFFEAGFAMWTLGKLPADDQDSVTPSHLAHRFFADQQGRLEESKSAYILYPAIGVLYQHRSGLAMVAELQYFINATDFSGALYGGAGAYYYF